MKIQSYKTNYKPISINNSQHKNLQTKILPQNKLKQADVHNINFKGNPLVEIKNAAKFLYAKKKVSDLKKYIDATDGKDSFVLRQFAMEPFEGLQYGIKAFKGMTMKEIQYLCENLHVIAVNRGCKNMCGYC